MSSTFSKLFAACMRAWVSAAYRLLLQRLADSSQLPDEALALEEAVCVAEDVLDGFLVVGGEPEQVLVGGFVVSEVLVERIHFEGLAGVDRFLVEGVHVGVGAHEAGVLARLELLVCGQAGVLCLISSSVMIFLARMS